MKKILLFTLITASLCCLLTAFTACDTLAPASNQFSYTLIKTWEGDTYYEVVGIKTRTTDVTIPSKYNGLPVRRIARYALLSSFVESLTIPSSITYISDDAFAYRDNFKEIYYQGNVDELAQLSSPGLWSIADNVYVDGKEIDGEIRLTTATSIGRNAFKNCLRLTEITIPSNVDVIENGAFDGCVNLSRVTIENGVKSIQQDAFRDCTSLKTITIPNSIEKNFEAFINCTALTEMVFEEGTRYLPIDLAANCPSLTKISVPNSVGYRPSLSGGAGAAFFGCNNIQYYEYEGGLYLGNDDNRFVALLKARDTSITSCKINEKTQTIFVEAFLDCPELRSIVIPKRITSIKNIRFTECEKFEKVYYAGSLSDWEALGITADENKKLTSATKYYYSEVKPTEEGNYWHYDGDGNVVEW